MYVDYIFRQYVLITIMAIHSYLPTNKFYRLYVLYFRYNKSFFVCRVSHFSVCSNSQSLMNGTFGKQNRNDSFKTSFFCETQRRKNPVLKQSDSLESYEMNLLN
jgi:hypothetical protein